MGENKYQLSYKKCIEEYRDRIYTLIGIGFRIKSKCGMFYFYKYYNRRHLFIYIIDNKYK